MHRLYYAIILILVVPMATVEVAEAQDAHYCVLRKAKLYAPENCFEFYLADTWRSDMGTMAIMGLFGTCGVTDLAARQGWEIDPFYTGPYTQRQGTVAMNELSRYGGNFYGCQENPQPDPPQPPDPPGPPLAGWTGTWQLTSHWQHPNTNSYQSTLVVQVSDWGVTVQHGNNEISHVSINGNTLTYQGNTGHHTHTITLWRNGDQLTGRFTGSFNSTGKPIRGTYTGHRR